MSAAFFGANGEIGVQLEDGKLGLMSQERHGEPRPAQPATYALTAEGTASLVGLPDQLTSPAACGPRTTPTGEEVDRPHRWCRCPASLRRCGRDFQEVSGTLDLAIRDFVTLHGNFTFTRPSATMTRQTHHDPRRGRQCQHLLRLWCRDHRQDRRGVEDGKLGLILHKTTNTDQQNS